jgi:hypothetical protein
MAKLKENLGCYSHPNQREVLLGILENESIRDRFFLTGGTALSVFYLHHRTSIDLDFFTASGISLDDIRLWIARHWPGECRIINRGDFILQMLVKDIKVDIVYDPLSFDEPREKVYFDDRKFMQIDSLRSISSNKLSSIVGRREIKDSVDYYFLNRMVESMNFETIYNDARKKEGMFDDPPTVAYQLELHFDFIKENEDLIPKTRMELDIIDFYDFFERLIQKTYRHKL